VKNAEILRIWNSLANRTYTEARVFSCVVSAYENGTREIEIRRARAVMRVVWPQNEALGPVPYEIRGNTADQNNNRNRQADFSRLMQMIRVASYDRKGAHPTKPASVPALAASRPAALPSTRDESFAEGRERLRLHRSLERNKTLVRRKKAHVSAADGKLACEVCGFDFAAVYGRLGDGFAECHHTRPMAEVRVVRQTKLSELAVVCANCHRMLHRRPFHSVPELAALVRRRRR
jgi:predicted HNH restriction endonuclease